MLKAYKMFWSRYAEFSGRSRRAEYWLAGIANFLVMILLAIVEMSLWGFPVLTILYVLAAIIPGIAMEVRRFHDTGRSGWLFLLNFIPCVGWIIVLVFMCLNSQYGPNQYGLNPKGEGNG